MTPDPILQRFLTAPSGWLNSLKGATCWNVSDDLRDDLAARVNGIACSAAI